MSWPQQSDDLVPVDRFLRTYGNDKACFHVYLMVLIIDRQVQYYLLQLQLTCYVACWNKLTRSEVFF